MIGKFSKRPRDGAVRRYAKMDWGRYYGSFCKWTKIFYLYMYPLIMCLAGLCGFPNYFQYRYARRGARRFDIYRHLLLCTSIPVGWRRLAHDYIPEF